MPDFLTKVELLCLKNETVFPDITKNILNKTGLAYSEEDKANLLRSIEEGHGLMIILNKELDLRLQFHGRFKSFLIGVGINADNENQPNIKLLRIETVAERTHNNNTMAFLGDTQVNEPHFHWYNDFYYVFYNQTIFHEEIANEQNYNRIIESFLQTSKRVKFSADILEQAVPYEQYVELHRLIKKENRQFREDGFISANANLKKDPKKVFQQILGKEIF